MCRVFVILNTCNQAHTHSQSVPVAHSVPHTHFGKLLHFLLDTKHSLVLFLHAVYGECCVPLAVISRSKCELCLPAPVPLFSLMLLNFHSLATSLFSLPHPLFIPHSPFLSFSLHLSLMCCLSLSVFLPSLPFFLSFSHPHSLALFLCLFVPRLALSPPHSLSLFFLCCLGWRHQRAPQCH